MIFNGIPIDDPVGYTGISGIVWCRYAIFLDERPWNHLLNDIPVWIRYRSNPSCHIGPNQSGFAGLDETWNRKKNKYWTPIDKVVIRDRLLYMKCLICRPYILSPGYVDEYKYNYDRSLFTTLSMVNISFMIFQYFRQINFTPLNFIKLYDTVWCNQMVTVFVEILS